MITVILTAAQFAGKTWNKVIWFLDYLVGLFMFIAIVNIMVSFYFDKPNKIYSIFWFIGIFFLTSVYYILR